MAQYQITVDDADVQGLFSEDGGLARLVEKVVNAILQGQFEQRVGAKRYERTAKRRAYRNGTRLRPMTTRVGKLTLQVAQTRNGQFASELFSRYQRSEQAFVLALMEMVLNGVSTRKVAAVTRELCGVDFSKSTVSRLCERLEPIVTSWNERPLGEHRYPFLIMDALLIRCREEGQVRPISALIATGVRASGEREVLGLQLGDSESERTWGAFLQWLKRRGLRGVDLVVSDDHSGLVRAVRTAFQGVPWQRCQTHFMRNILDAAPKALRTELKGQLRAVLEAPDRETARVLRDKVAAQFAARAPRAMQVLEEGFDDATAVMALPASVRRRARTTNMVERLNRELRRRERVIGIFPNRDSAIRLIGALLMELDEHWRIERRLYLNMSEYWAWRKTARPRASVRQVVTRIG